MTDPDLPQEPIPSSDRGTNHPPGDDPVADRKESSLWERAVRKVKDASATATSYGEAISTSANAIGSAAASTAANIGQRSYAIAGGAIESAVGAGKAAIEASKIESAIKFLDQQLDDRGVKQSLKDATGSVVGKLDQLIGKQLLELVEQRLQLQDNYNNIMAAKLAEALNRIAALESELRTQVADVQASDVVTPHPCNGSEP